MRMSAVLASLFLLSTPALADDWADCKGNDFDTVVAACTRLISTGSLADADTIAALSNRGWALRSKGDYDKAASDFEQCKKLSDTNTYCPASLADLAFAKGLNDDAVVLADKVLAMNPAYTWPMVIKGAALKSKGQYTAAIDVLNQALAIDPRYAYALYQRGAAYSNLEQYDKAVVDFSKSLLIDKTYNDARSSRGYAYFSLGKLDKAINDLNACLTAAANDPYAHAVRGLILLNQGKNDDALSDFDKAIELNSSVNWYYTYRGLARIKANKLDLAQADLEHALVNSPQGIEVNTFLGMLKEAKGDKPAAIAAYRIAIASQAGISDERKAQEIALTKLAELDAQ